MCSMATYTIADAEELFDNFGGPRPEWFDNPTPKQRENWEEYGADTVSSIPGSLKNRWWYLRTYRPKKRGDGMMERDHVQISEPEHYYKKTIEGLKRPMGSIQGEVMAGMFVDDDVKEEINEAAAKYVLATTSDAEKARIAQQAQRLAGVIGLE
jgi:hypothetical protein